MKQTLTALILFIFLVGCSDNRVGTKNNPVNIAGYGSGASVVEVNKCQYVIYQGNNSGDFSMVHAGNCNNPQHITGLPPHTVLVDTTEIKIR